MSFTPAVAGPQVRPVVVATTAVQVVVARGVRAPAALQRETLAELVLQPEEVMEVTAGTAAVTGTRALLLEVVVAERARRPIPTEVVVMAQPEG